MAIQAIMMGVGVGMKALSAYSAYEEGQELGEQYRHAGALLKSESYREANIIRDQGHMFAQEQKMAYLGTGVQYAGSALVTVAQTKKFAESEAKAQERRGDALERQQIQLGERAEQAGEDALLDAAFDIGTMFASGGVA